MFGWISLCQKNQCTHDGSRHRGHVFPALAVADEMVARGAVIHWFGTPKGMENELVAKHGHTMHHIDMQGLRGKGLVRAIKLPFMLFKAVMASKNIIKTIT